MAHQLLAHFYTSVCYQFRVVACLPASLASLEVFDIKAHAHHAQLYGLFFFSLFIFYNNKKARGGEWGGPQPLCSAASWSRLAIRGRSTLQIVPYQHTAPHARRGPAGVRAQRRVVLQHLVCALCRRRVLTIHVGSGPHNAPFCPIARPFSHRHQCKNGRPKRRARAGEHAISALKHGPPRRGTGSN